MSRYGDQFRWTAAELAVAEEHLQTRHGSDPFSMADLARTALRFTGAGRTARALRDNLLASGRIVVVVARGRGASYRVNGKSRR